MLWLQSDGLENPLAEAWRRAFVAAGVPTLGIYAGPAGTRLPEGWSHESEALDGAARPDCVVWWWGLDALARSRPGTLSPRAKRVLILDTFPNAARLVTAVREMVRARLRRLKPHTVVCYSEEMRRSIRSLHVLPRSTQLVVLLQPFPLAMHRDRDPGDSAQSVIFTGRSDHLFTTRTSMIKDRVGPALESLVRRGALVTVNQPDSPLTADDLRRRGFDLYPRMTNDDVLAGRLAEVVSRHDVHACFYHDANATLRRRQANGLSSRFALGLTANTPVVVPMSAVGAVRVLERTGVGVGVESIGGLDLATIDHETMRRRWREQHHGWSAEGQRDALRDIAT